MYHRKDLSRRSESLKGKSLNKIQLDFFHQIELFLDTLFKDLITIRVKLSNLFNKESVQYDP